MVLGDHSYRIIINRAIMTMIDNLQLNVHSTN